MSCVDVIMSISSLSLGLKERESIINPLSKAISAGKRDDDNDEGAGEVEEEMLTLLKSLVLPLLLAPVASSCNDSGFVGMAVVDVDSLVDRESK